MEKAKNKKPGRRILSIALAVALMGLLQAIPGTVRTAYAADAGAFIVEDGEAGTDYDYADGVLTIKTDTSMTIKNSNPEVATTDIIVVAKDVSANITLAGVNIDVSETGDLSTIGKAAFMIEDDSTGNVTIILADGTVNSLISGTYRAGLEKNGTTGTLIICGGAKGTGSLTAQGGRYGAGIGGGHRGAGTGITINGGTVTATGGCAGAGIGGGDERGAGSNITINGGTVTAMGGGEEEDFEAGAGIGGGDKGAGSNITINGGTVTAMGGAGALSYGGAGIGGGNSGAGTGIFISGGSVKVISTKANAIGGGKDNAAVTPTLKDGTPVYLFNVQNENGEAIKINKKDYPTAHGEETAIYAYLPSADEFATVQVGAVSTKYGYDTESAKWLKVIDVPKEDTNKYVYDGNPKTYQIAESADYTISGNTTQTNAGTYTVTVTRNDAENTMWSDKTTGVKEFTFEIQKADSAVASVPEAKSDLVYNGSEHALISGGSATNGTMQYSLSEDGTYSETIPVGTNAGDYTVYYKVVGDANHKDTAVVNISVTIAQAALDLGEVTGTDLVLTEEPTGVNALVQSIQCTNNIEGTFEITDAELVYGTHTYNWKFTPADSNYKAVTDTVTIKVTKKPGNVDNVYQISNAGELLWFVEKVNGGETTINAKLTEDIAMNGIDWTMMSSFAGTFDGNGYTISGLNGHIDLQDNNKVHGFIRTLADGGFVKNLTFTGAKVFNHEGDGAISAVIVYTNNGTVENCVVKSSNIHHGGYDALGVVVGVNARTIRNCASISNTMTRRYSSSKNVCGFVWSNSGSIVNCFNYDCTYQNGSNRYAFTGIDNGTITNCYYYESSETLSDTTAEGAIEAKSAAQFASGEVAYLLNGSTSTGTLAWYQTLSGEPDAYPVLNSTHETVYQIKKYDCPEDTEAEVVYSNTNEDIIAEEHSFEGCVCRICKNVVHKEFDKEGFCTACGNGYEPAKQVSSEHHAELTATYNGYYAIETAGQLYWFAEYVNAGNTTANAVLTANLVVNASLEGTPREWTPIGNDANPYNGTFDGNGKTVSGLYIYDIVEANDTGVAGLIGCTAENARIEKVGVIGSSFTITGKLVYIGGVCGANDGSITNCYYTGTVSGNRRSVGGVCGVNDGSITNCYNTGSVSGTNQVGGVCGNNGGSITNCYNTGSVSGSERVGGVCGDVGNRDTVTTINCYNTGSVSGTNQVGGVCGYVKDAIVTSCYNLGSVSGTEVVGGVCGYSYLGRIRNCYYDSTVYTGNAIGDDSSDPISGVIEGKTTTQFASGEVTYLLNGTVTDRVWSAGATDGTQSWYQTLSGNKTDAYPVLNSTHKTVYQIKKYDCPEDTEAEVLYSNTAGDIKGTEHSYVNSVCTGCGKKLELTITLDEGGSFADGEYTFANNVHTISTEKKVTITGTTTTETVVIASGVNANITLNGVSIDVSKKDYACAFKIADNSKGNVTITLADGSANILKSSSRNFAGLQKNGTEGTLTICGEINGTGSLTATGGECGAGIGGGYEGAGTGITINGGIVEATGGTGGAGIGGGYNRGGTNITINGGMVTATGENAGAGIGGGYYKDGTNIIINGGTVKATSVEGGGAGIGGGDRGAGTGITINGGTVTATGSYGGAGIGGGSRGAGTGIIISGGSVKATAGEEANAIGGGQDSATTTPTLADKTTPVYLFEIDNAGSANIVINGTDYPDAHGEETKIYAYLPAGTDAEPNKIQVGETVTRYYYDVESGSWVKTCGSGNHTDTNNDCACDNCEYTFEHEDGDEDGLCDKENCGAIVNGIAAVDSNSLNLQDNVEINYYMKLSQETLADEGAYLQVTLPGGSSQTIALNTVDKEEDGRYKFTFDVAAAEMADVVSVQVFLGDGSTSGEAFTYSVREYAEAVLGNDEYAAVQPVVKAMLNYGAYAQTYFGHNTGSLANEGLNLSLEEVPVNGALSGYGKRTEGSLPDGIEYTGSSLLLESNVVIRHYFRIDRTKVAELPMVDASWGTWKQKGEKYYLEQSVVAAKLDNETTLSVGEVGEVDEWTIHYSALSYVKAVLENESNYPEGLVNLLKALYHYSQAASKYFNE